MPKRPLPWQLEKQRTAKGLREYPRCATMGCTGTAIGTMFGSDLCPACVQRHRQERTHFVDGSESVGLTYCGGNVFVGDVPRNDRVTEDWSLVTCAMCKAQRAPRSGT